MVYGWLDGDGGLFVLVLSLLLSQGPQGVAGQAGHKGVPVSKSKQTFWIGTMSN